VVLTTRLLCIAFASLGMPEAAIPYIECLSISNSPHCSDRCWTGRLQLEIGAAEEALATFSDILNDFPGNPFARQCLGVARQSIGDNAGYIDSLQFAARNYWQQYYSQATYIEKMWEGESLEGKSIAVVPHGGFGDYFQFARYISALREAGAREIIGVASDRCAGLLLSAGFDRIETMDRYEDVKRASDYWAGVYGLEHARLLGAPQGARSAYLTAPFSLKSELIAQTMRQNAKGRPCVGLYWHSDADGGESKSVPMHEMLRLFSNHDIHWVILQRGYGLRRLMQSGLSSNTTVLEEDLSFDETGALMTKLDGVISICAWSLHLAAALGVKTWLLAGRVLNARHENREKASVLYPGIVTLARQPSHGDWGGAIRFLDQDIRKKLIGEKT
jgi:hypothetical protein